MQQKRAILEELARKPIDPTLHYEGKMHYASPRMTRDCEGTLHASTTGITGRYEVAVQKTSIFKILDNALQDGETPGKLVTPDKQALITCPGPTGIVAFLVFEKSTTVTGTTADIQYC